jgi:hypothetical protein
MTTFGMKEWPPPQLLPAAIRDRLTAFGEARDRVAKAQAELGGARRLGLPEARRQDLELAANAVEEGKAPPKVSHEQKVAQKIAGLEHEIEVADLVQKRCSDRLLAAVEEHAAQISHEAERRMGKAKQDYLDAIERLAGASEALAEAVAFRTWASDPVGSSFKQRSLRNVPVERHADEGPSIDMVLDGLRRVMEPRQRPSIPSPFPAPQAEPEAEPAAGHSFEAELAAGSPPAA